VSLGKLHHPAQIFLAEAWAMLVNQLSCQRYDNLLAVRSSFLAENFIDDPFADPPIE
jgi:hypothetical protein